ncbi:efflux RND transporter periplasmic adaptor subunit [Bremerella sp. TYQ1]|uniref:efflux RND transporter periplasmic adaptor subunit n=1 Tax=Bremerella sp. TYQ1 TaxID=3119568 RepID=UPI001CCA6459|nr:HlyD family efflux transporter periplasmic adaptor subunit [Bremerella volcania]UBM35342.1 HlyD family efflux transporter periplasmic adaptor subunit [Bremerella volcania]
MAFAQFRKEIPRHELSEQPRPLPVIRVEPKEVVPKITGFGTASAARRWEAVSELQGRIVEIHSELESGNLVGANELLIRIDDTDSRLLLAQRQADLDAAKTRLDELEAGYEADQRLLPLAQEQLQVAEREEQRYVELRRQKAASLSNADQATSSRLAQQQAVQNIQRALSLFPSQKNAAKASIALAEAKLREAERDVERTRIVSPFAGVLSEANLEIGQFITVNQRLFTLRDAEQIEITAHFSLEQIDRLISRDASPSAKSQMSLEKITGELETHPTQTIPFSARVIARSGNFTRTWNGVPVRITESLNEQSRTLGVVVQVTNIPHHSETQEATLSRFPTTNNESHFAHWSTALRPGTFCEVVLESSPRSDLITIPRSALNENTVYRVDSDNRLHPQSVEIGFSNGEFVTVVGGLKEGDIIAEAVPVPAIEGQLIEPRFADTRSSQFEIVTAAIDSSTTDAKERRQ